MFTANIKIFLLSNTYYRRNNRVKYGPKYLPKIIYRESFICNDKTENYDYELIKKFIKVIKELKKDYRNITVNLTFDGILHVTAKRRIN